MLINKEFYTRPNHLNKVLSQYNDKYYLIAETDLISGNTRNDILLTEEQIVNYLNEQDFIIEKVNKAIKSHKKMLEIEQQEQEKREQEEREYNNTYGYTDNMPAMKKGKILKVLNKKESTSKYGLQTRKDFICQVVKDGYEIKEEHNVKYYSSRTKTGYTIKETEYQIHFENYYNSITKIEYDYAMYLKNNGILKAS